MRLGEIKDFIVSVAVTLFLKGKPMGLKQHQLDDPDVGIKHNRGWYSFAG